jgi:hypothetical protein
VKKFTDRSTGVSRIWKALQELNQVQDQPAAELNEESLAGQPVTQQVLVEQPSSEAAETPVEIAERNAPVTPETRDVETPEASSTEQPTPTEVGPVSAKPARQGSKGAIILGLLKGEGGATLEEMMAATGWQKHSLRGFPAGTVNKKMGLNLTSTKGEDKIRRYSIAE